MSTRIQILVGLTLRRPKHLSNVPHQHFHQNSNRNSVSPDTRDMLWNEWCWVLLAVLNSWLSAWLWHSTHMGFGTDCSWFVCLLSHCHPLEWGHLCSLDTDKDIGQGRTLLLEFWTFLLSTCSANCCIKALRFKMHSLYTKTKWVHVNIGEFWIRSIAWLLFFFLILMLLDYSWFTMLC